MSLAQVPYQVLYAQDFAHPVDISDKINSVLTNNQGSGRIRTGTIMLDAQDGQFITNTQGGATPIISKFDRIVVEWEDNAGNFTFYYLEVDQILKQQNEKTGTLLPLELKGRERALQDVKTFGYYQFKSAKFVIDDLLAIYNANAGATFQPQIVAFNFDTSTLTNLAPDTVLNTYDFTDGKSIHDCIMEVVRRLNQATDLGGTGDYYSVTYNDNATQDDTVTINIFVQGTVQGVTPGSFPIIESTNTDPIHNITVQDNTPQGTQVFVRGMQNTSTLPPDLHRYSSYIEIIESYPTYISTSTYTAGIRVQYGGTVYQARGFVPLSQPPPNALYWQAMTATDLINNLIAANYPTYDPTKTYPIGSDVSFAVSAGLNVGYEAILFVPTSTPPPNPTYWKALSINYSLWTKQKDIVTKNSCSNPDNPFATGSLNDPAFPDGNMVIRDRVNSETGEYIFFRDWVMCRAIDPAHIQADSRLSKYLMEGTFYQGFTVLVDTNLGTPTGAFAANGGKDINGRFFADAFVIWDGYNWIVTRTPVSSSSSDSELLQIGDQCIVYIEGRTYEYNKAITDVNQLVYGAIHSTNVYPYKYIGPNVGLSKWQDVSALQGGNDVWHHPKSIECVDGFYPKLIGPLDFSSYISQSALKITYEFDLGSTLYQKGKSILDKLIAGGTKFIQGLEAGQILDVFTLTDDEKALVSTLDYSNYGWWYALPFPYPFSTFNGIAEKVGDFYGGGDVTASEFGALDIINANFTHSGLRGLNNKEVSDMGGPTTGLQFVMQFDILYGGVTQRFQGNMPFTITVLDDLRNVWRADFSIRFLSTPQAIPIPWSAFSVDRPSRVPINIDAITKNLVDLISPSELEIRNIFEEKRVRLITIQYAGSYDEFLRYSPANIDKMIRTGAGAIPVQFVGIIDALAFTKVPFVSSGVVTDRVINPEFVDAPNVRNYVQLQSIAQAEKDVFGLPFEQYTVKRNGHCDLVLEQSVYLKDINLINEEDKPSTPNTRKLILMTDTTSYDQTDGFISTQILTKRLGGP